MRHLDVPEEFMNNSIIFNLEVDLNQEVPRDLRIWNHGTELKVCLCFYKSSNCIFHKSLNASAKHPFWEFLEMRIGQVVMSD